MLMQLPENVESLTLLKTRSCADAPLEASKFSQLFANPSLLLEPAWRAFHDEIRNRVFYIALCIHDFQDSVLDFAVMASNADSEKDRRHEEEEGIFDPVRFAMNISYISENIPRSSTLSLYGRSFPTSWLYTDFEAMLTMQVQEYQRLSGLSYGNL